jgi:hypothetical protein
MQVSSSTACLGAALARLHRLAYFGVLVAVVVVFLTIGVALGKAYPLRPQPSPVVTVVKVRQVLLPWPTPEAPRVEFAPLALIVSRDPAPAPVEPVIPPQPRPDKHAVKSVPPHAAAQKKGPQRSQGQVAPAKTVHRWGSAQQF